MCDNLENCCRICLDMESQHVSILGDPIINLHIKTCLSMVISPNDELPTVICTACVTQLREFYHFLLNAKCSQDWLESTIQEKSKKPTETKTSVHPLPDSEYNSDSLLEFLNNTANIDEYLRNLGKEDIPSFANLLDKNADIVIDSSAKTLASKHKTISPKIKEITIKKDCKMEIDVLDSDIEIVKEILTKKSENDQSVLSSTTFSCFACKTKVENIQKLSQHLSICELASRTCIHCQMLFDAKHKMQIHSASHQKLNPLTCDCGKQFQTKLELNKHYKVCHIDYLATLGCVYRCKQCSQTFPERFLLYKHVKKHIHQAEKRICDICGHIFYGNEALIKHRQEIHKMPETVLYRCKVCSMTCGNHKEMYIHVRKHLGKEPKTHLCESCGRSFATHSSLSRHSLQHKHKHKLECNVCNITFTDISSKEKHITEHVENVMCEKCGVNVNNLMLNSHTCK